MKRLSAKQKMLTMRGHFHEIKRMAIDIGGFEADEKNSGV